MDSSLIQKRVTLKGFMRLTEGKIENYSLGFANKKSFLIHPKHQDQNESPLGKMKGLAAPSKCHA